MKLEEAGALADRIVHCIEDLCDRIQVAGSTRRRRPEVNDIDMVLIPQHMMWTSIVQRIKDQFKAKVVLGGQQLVRMHVPQSLPPVPELIVQVDLYRATYETWGTLLLIRTGSIDHNIMMCSRAQKMGMMLSASDGVIKDAKVIASRTEEEIFKALEMDFIPPEKREIQ